MAKLSSGFCLPSFQPLLFFEDWNVNRTSGNSISLTHFLQSRPCAHVITAPLKIKSSFVLFTCVYFRPFSHFNRAFVSVACYMIFCSNKSHLQTCTQSHDFTCFLKKFSLHYRYIHHEQCLIPLLIELEITCCTSHSFTFFSLQSLHYLLGVNYFPVGNSWVGHSKREGMSSCVHDDNNVVPTLDHNHSLVQRNPPRFPNWFRVRIGRQMHTTTTGNVWLISSSDTTNGLNESVYQVESRQADDELFLQLELCNYCM